MLSLAAASAAMSASPSRTGISPCRGPDAWVSPLVTAFMVPLLIERDAAGQARALLAGQKLTGELGPTWPFTMVRYARGRLRAAVGEHEEAAGELLAAGQLAAAWGIRNPAFMSWRSDAALSLGALGDRQGATRLCGEAVGLARRWGAARRGRAGAARGRAWSRAATGASSCSPRRWRAPRFLGAARAGPRAGRPGVGALPAQALAGRGRDLLREGLDIAHARGGIVLAGRARDELVIAGGRPRRDALRGRDALTPSELRVAQLAAAGQTNRQIAQALFVTQRTVENHLTSTYGKLGISSRPGTCGRARGWLGPRGTGSWPAAGQAGETVTRLP